MDEEIDTLIRRIRNRPMGVSVQEFSETLEGEGYSRDLLYLAFTAARLADSMPSD